MFKSPDFVSDVHVLMGELALVIFPSLGISLFAPLATWEGWLYLQSPTPRSVGKKEERVVYIRGGCRPQGHNQHFFIGGGATFFSNICINSERFRSSIFQKSPWRKISRSSIFLRGRGRLFSSWPLLELEGGGVRKGALSPVIAPVSVKTMRCG